MRELTQLQQAIQAAFPQTQLRFEEPLARHTSFKIGGPCEVMAFPCGIQELSDLLRWAHSHEVQPAILGAAPMCWLQTPGGGDWSFAPGAVWTE